MTDKPKSMLVHVGEDGKPSIADPRVFVRMTALRAVARIMAGSMEVNGATARNVAAASLCMADDFDRWLQVGEGPRTGATGSIEPTTQNTEGP